MGSSVEQRWFRVIWFLHSVVSIYEDHVTSWTILWFRLWKMWIGKYLVFNKLVYVKSHSTAIYSRLQLTITFANYVIKPSRNKFAHIVALLSPSFQFKLWLFLRKYKSTTAQPVVVQCLNLWVKKISIPLNLI